MSWPTVRTVGLSDPPLHNGIAWAIHGMCRHPQLNPGCSTCHRRSRAALEHLRLLLGLMTVEVVATLHARDFFSYAYAVQRLNGMVELTQINLGLRWGH